MLVVGTSGVVYPAAQLPDLARAAGARILEINLEATPLSDRTDVTLLGAAGTLLPQLQALLGRA
jgi:NAD-dependent deacetylase